MSAPSSRWDVALECNVEAADDEEGEEAEEDSEECWMEPLPTATTNRPVEEEEEEDD